MYLIWDLAFAKWPLFRKTLGISLEDTVINWHVGQCGYQGADAATGDLRGVLPQPDPKHKAVKDALRR